MKSGEERKILPRVKRYVSGSGEVWLGANIAVCGDEAAYVSQFLAEYYPTAVGEGGIRFVQADDLPSEAYKIVVNKDVCVWFSDRAGARNAASSLVQSIERHGEQFVLPCCEIEDQPSCSFRSVMIDLARGLPDLARLKEDIRRLALFKCNYLHLHLVDSQGTCFKSDVMPFTGQINGTERAEKSYLREIAASCKRLGIEIIPEIEIPSHASGLYSLDENVRCVTDLPDPSPANVCAGSEYVYRLFTALIDEILEIFKDGNYFHVGGDEIMFDDYPTWNYHCHYDRCKVCRAAAKREGIEPTVQNMYYYLMRRMHDILAKRNRTMIVWNDEIDTSQPVPLPKDVIVQYWQTAAPGRGPWKGASYQGYLERGFRVINSAVAYAYIDNAVYFNPERASGFVWNETPNPGEYAEQVLGTETCAWEYGNPKNTHYLVSFPFATALLLDRAWNAELVAYGVEYRRALTRAMFGADTPIGYDVSALFGSIVPPRENERISFATVENELYRKGQVMPIAERLAGIERTYSPILLQQIRTLFATEK